MLSSTENPPLEFNPGAGEESQVVRVPTSKIGWLHSVSDEPGARFDITIKDALGRTKFERKNCGNDTEKFGELVNLETRLGEDLQVSVTNIRGAKKVQLFLN
jgi:hypothetical protein